MIILDSDHCIAILRGKLDLNQRIDPQDTLAVTTISIGELVHGVHKSARTFENLAKLDILLSNLVVLGFDESAARRFGEVKARLEEAGAIIGDLDMQIASIALAHDAALVTHNQHHFNRVPDLVIGDWLEK